MWSQFSLYKRTKNKNSKIYTLFPDDIYVHVYRCNLDISYHHCHFYKFVYLKVLVVKDNVYVVGMDYYLTVREGYYESIFTSPPLPLFRTIRMFKYPMVVEQYS